MFDVVQIGSSVERLYVDFLGRLPIQALRRLAYRLLPVFDGCSWMTLAA